MVSVEPPETTWPRVDPLPAGAQERARVDAVMRLEARILVGDQHRDIAWVDVVRRRRQAPAPVGHGERTQEPAVAVDDDASSLRARP